MVPALLCFTAIFSTAAHITKGSFWLSFPHSQKIIECHLKVIYCASRKWQKLPGPWARRKLAEVHKQKDFLKSLKLMAVWISSVLLSIITEVNLSSYYEQYESYITSYQYKLLTFLCNRLRYRFTEVGQTPDKTSVFILNSFGRFPHPHMTFNADASEWQASVSTYSVCYRNRKRWRYFSPDWCWALLCRGINVMAAGTNQTHCCPNDWSVDETYV